MAYCPNCASQLDASATNCAKCGADFGPTSAWKTIQQSPEAASPGVQANPRRFGLAILALAAIALGNVAWFGYGYFVRQPSVFEGPGLKFTAGSCNKGKASEGVRSTAWRADGTLRIDALLIANCAAQVRNGGYAARSGTIYLSYDAKIDGIRAACNCAYHVTYDISGLPKADYKVYFPKTGMSLP